MRAEIYGIVGFAVSGFEFGYDIFGFLFSETEIPYSRITHYLHKGKHQNTYVTDKRKDRRSNVIKHQQRHGDPAQFVDGADTRLGRENETFRSGFQTDSFVHFADKLFASGFFFGRAGQSGAVRFYGPDDLHCFFCVFSVHIVALLCATRSIIC